MLRSPTRTRKRSRENDDNRLSLPLILLYLTHVFQVNADANLELRATLCWLDPPTPAMTVRKIQHDLDLTMTSPSGDVYTMWGSGTVDSVNVNERVIVRTDQLESGAWNLKVSSKALLTDSQDYSLVITGAISNVNMRR